MAVIATIEYMEKKPKNFIIDVIPLTRLPLSRKQYFSYEFERKLPAGTLVEIPLFNRILDGIVMNSHDDFHQLGNIKLKKVIAIIEKSFLTPKQLELAKFISDYYICSLGIVLKFFVPKHIKARNLQLTTYNSPQKKIKLTKGQQEAVNKISNFQFPISNFLLFGPASSGKTEVYIHAIARLKAQNSKYQFLILLPELTLTPQAIERYGAIFKPEEITVIHSKITKGEFYANWQKIKSGEAKIIIGTRMAVFAPFKNLKLIVIDEEQDPSFKQWDMNPRYDARKVTEKLAKIYQAIIVHGSATPSVETYYKALENKYNLIKLPYLEIPNKFKILPPKVEIVDMHKERWNNQMAGGFSPISKTLKSEIDYALKNKLQTILFINRQGMSFFSVCAKCKTVLRCPKCERALIYESNGLYKCLRCSYKTSTFATCPKCKGIEFKNIGLGTQKVERELARIFPGIRLKRADFESIKKASDIDKLYREFGHGDYDILIGTQMITKGWDNPNVGLIGIIDADNLFSIPDFRTSEKAFQLMVQVSGRTGRLKSKFPGKVLIQTFNPYDFIIKKAAKMSYEEFYEKEIEDRKDLNYPPFSLLIRLIYQNYNQKKVEDEPKRVYDEISSKFANAKCLSISRPQNPLISKVRGKSRKQIIIKSKNEIPEGLKEIIKNLGSNWTVDRDPINII